MPDRSYSVLDIQDYIEYIIKRQETLTAFYVYIIWIDKKLVLKIKDGYKLELHLKQWNYQKKSIDKIKNGENVPSLEVVESLLVQCNLVDH